MHRARYFAPFEYTTSPPSSSPMRMGESYAASKAARPEMPPRYVRRSMACNGALKRIIESREHSYALAAVTDIHVSDHEGPRDAAKSHTADGVQLVHGGLVAVREYATKIDERRDFDVQIGGDGVE